MFVHNDMISKFDEALFKLISLNLDFFFIY